jgi:DNA-binding Lrp family transcriptional regulator
MQSINFQKGDDIDEKRTILICEGEADWLTWKQCGYNNVLSVPMGAPNPNAKNFDHEFDYVNDPYVQSFMHRDNIDQIIFSTDNDKPGRFLRDHLAIILGKDRCKYINYPVGYKDINDVYNGNKKVDPPLPALGQEGVDECYQNISSFAVKGVIRPSDLREDLERLAKDGFTKGYGIGVDYVDNLFTIKRKLIAFITGVPGCFTSDQLVHTNRGVISISEVQQNDKVLSYNHEKDINEYRSVLRTHKHISHPDKLYKIKLKDGTIIKVTENHEFFTGVSYVQIREILLSSGKIKKQ